MEQSVSNIPKSYGGFLQIAGFKFTYAQSAPAGSRITVMTLDQGADGGVDEPIPDDANYKITVVTNDFTKAGGDGYVVLAALPKPPLLGILADDLTAYVKANPNITVSTVTDRITALP